MTWQQAMQETKQIVAKNYSYSHMQHMNTEGKVMDYQKLNMVHYTFDGEGPLNEIQVTFEFKEKFFDMLAFPHPVVLKEEGVNETVKLINYVNSIIKVGRLYVDTDYLDIVFSERIPYSVFGTFLEDCIDRCLGFALCLFHDIAYPMYAVATRKISVEEGINCVDEMWSYENK